MKTGTKKCRANRHLDLFYKPRPHLHAGSFGPALYTSSILDRRSKNQPTFRLPLRHEMGERAGVRWCSGNRGRSFRTIYKNYQTNPLSFSNLPVNKSNRHSHLMNRPKNEPKIPPRLSLHALCASALVRKQVGGAPNFLMFHPCTDCRATAKLPT